MKRKNKVPTVLSIKTKYHELVFAIKRSRKRNRCRDFCCNESEDRVWRTLLRLLIMPVEEEKLQVRSMPTPFLAPSIPLGFASLRIIEYLRNLDSQSIDAGNIVFEVVQGKLSSNLSLVPSRIPGGATHVLPWG